MKILWLVLGLVWGLAIYLLVGEKSVPYDLAGYLIGTLLSILVISIIFKKDGKDG